MKKSTKKPVIIIVQTPGAAVPAAPAVGVAASVTGDTAPGATLTGTPATFTGTGVVVTNSWRKNGATTGSTGLTYSDTADGDSMVFHSTGTNGGGSTYSDSAAIVVVEPSGLSAFLRGYDRSSIESGFRDEYSLVSSTGPWTTLGTASAISGTGSTFEQERGAFDPNTQVWIRRVAFNGFGDASGNPVVEYWTPPAAPSGLTVSNINSYTQKLEFTASSPLNGGFRIFQSTNGTDYEFFDIAAAGDREFYATGLISETQYYYKVLAHNTVSESGFSNAVTATTGVADPVLILHFEDASGTTIVDSSGNGNNGTLVGANEGVVSVHREPGAIANDSSKKSFYAYGPSCHLDLGNPTELQIVGQIALRVWVKPNSWPSFGSPYGVIVAKGYDGLAEGYFLRLFYDAGTIKLQFGSYNGIATLVEWTVTGWSLASWKQITATYDGSYLRIYVNAVEVASSAAIIGAVLSDSNVCVFGEFLATGNGSFGRGFDGTLDELEIFAAGLPAARILTDYEATL